MNAAIRTSLESTKVCAAFVKAQAKMDSAKKDSTNPHFRSKFASLQSVFEAFSTALSGNSLGVMQAVTDAPAGVHITTRLIHESGEWIESGPAFFPATKMDAQGYGSATTYGKRYSVCAMLGIVADDDDDGNAASKAKTAVSKARGNPPSGSAREVTKDAFDAMDDKTQQKLQRAADYVDGILQQQGADAARAEFDSLELDTEQTLAIWWCMDSKLRNLLKNREDQLEKEPA